MRESRQATAWAVYMMAVHGKPGGVSAVCEQGEWDQMELDNPGRHALVRGGIRSEAEAEALARTTSGYVVARPATALKPAVKRAKRAATCNPLLGKPLP